MIIVGKDECIRYRNQVPYDQRLIAVAGMFNTGTNLLDTQMQKNIHVNELQDQHHVWQVPWGKHRMASVKHTHTANNMEEYNKNDVLPIVIIRDPYAWLQSMCASPYATHWRHGHHHCPNFQAAKLPWK